MNANASRQSLRIEAYTEPDARSSACVAITGILSLMTTVDVTYRYAAPPRESSVLALANVREVYGIRRVDLDERSGTIHIEYDATRLSEPIIRQLLRRAGLMLVDAAAAPASVVDAQEQAAATTP